VPGRIARGRSKADFAEFASAAGVRTPRTFALIAGGLVQHAAFATGEPARAFLAKVPAGHYFCKPNMGRNGIGAFRLTVSSDSAMMDEEPSSFAEVAERLSSEDYIIQEWVAPFQHPDISRFRAGVINTLRLITFDTESGPRAVAASLRMAIALKSIDSWTQGGVVAAIDLEKGVLKPFGILKKSKQIVESHPGSGIAFRDQPVPHYHRAVSMACDMHAMLAGPKSLGWDIGLLEDGPCFLESNVPWDILMSAQFNPTLVPEFLALHLPPSCESAIRLDMQGSFIDLVPLCRTLGKILGASIASGRVEQRSRERIVLTVGGPRRAITSALHIFRQKGREIGVNHIAVQQSADKPSPGFDASAVFA
jgi:hypothetical protein